MGSLVIVLTDERKSLVSPNYRPIDNKSTSSPSHLYLLDFSPVIPVTKEEEINEVLSKLKLLSLSSPVERMRGLPFMCLRWIGTYLFQFIAAIYFRINLCSKSTLLLVLFVPPFQ